MALYVSFNDSHTDPTYSNADSCVLVRSNLQFGNPCAENESSVPLIPVTEDEIKAWAEMMGWDCKMINGALHLIP